jgi:hypothetical protein
MKKKDKAVADPVEQWMQLEPGGPQDWEWVVENGMRIRPAKGRFCDLVLPPDRPTLSEEELDELLRWDREDGR